MKLLSQKIAEGLKNPSKKEATAVLNVKLDLTFDIALDPKEHLRGDKLIAAIVENAVDYIEVVYASEAGEEKGRTIADFSVIDSCLNGTKPPPKPVDLLAHTDQDEDTDDNPFDPESPEGRAFENDPKYRAKVRGHLKDCQL